MRIEVRIEVRTDLEVKSSEKFPWLRNGSLMGDQSFVERQRATCHWNVKTRVRHVCNLSSGHWDSGKLLLTSHQKYVDVDRNVEISIAENLGFNRYFKKYDGNCKNRWKLFLLIKF